jgi:hypothetical protein
MTPNNHMANRFMKWKLFSILPGLLLAHAVLATDPLYQNYAVLNYTVPGNPPPNIDAIAFDNESVFNVTFSQYSCNPVFYETWNTVNYTNNGTMTVNAPGGGCIFGTASGAGFRFDKQTTNVMNPRTMAGTFYNPSTIRCNSFLDGNDTFIFLGTQFFSVGTIGECIVSATNIVNPGTIVVGVNSLIQLNGQNVDLTRGMLTVEPLQSLFFGNSVGVFSTAFGFGVDTNQDWDPSIALTPTTAYSSLPYIIYLTNSMAYFDFRYPATNHTVIRAVFVQNTSPNATYNVYIDPNVDIGSFGFAPGAAHVEWVGAVNDPTTCGTTTNYLYLTDDYVLGASTNVFINNGAPDNFTFIASPTPLLSGPVAPGFFNVFPSGATTNFYSYFDGQLISTTAPTNATPLNPSGAITNMPGRIQITANNELNLGLVLISGQNYLSLTATNQFDGSVGAQIAAPYSDINLGVTNGFLVITNLLESAIPNWSGFVAAWSTRLLTTVSNTLDGTNFFIVTNDFRILIVRSSQLTPVTAPQVQNLSLHATNSLLITDVLNVFGSLFIDAQNLTLTTNGCGNGATSTDGELNLETSAILWQSSLPNVRNLTNNGAIRTHNLAQFMCLSRPAAAATGTLSEVGTNGNVAANNAVTIGTYTYAFVNTITNTAHNQVKIAATFDGSMINLIAAINHAAGSGTTYSTNTTANTLVTAGLLTNHSFTVTAMTAGSSGNSIVTTNSTSTTNLTWNGHATLSGGVDYGAGPYYNFINYGLISDQGSTIYADNFLSSGIISNGVGSFLLQSLTTVLTNGAIVAGGDVSITTGSLVTSNLMLRAGRSLTLQATNLLTDSFFLTNGFYPNTTNLNFWSVGSSGVGGSDSGFNLPILPNWGDLLGTTVTNIAPTNKSIINVWAGRDFGVSLNGYSNNEAVGRLILDALSAPPHSLFTFNGAGTSNAMYVDYLELRDQATNRDGSGNFTALSINTNMVIYYASAFMNGLSIADKMNHKNADRLRWVPEYLGYFSSTNIVYPDGTTNTINISLAQSTTLDSDGDGIANAFDPTPLFVSSQLDFTLQLTNNPSPTVLIKWHSIPSATNVLLFSTNLMLPSYTWPVLTNFISPSLVPPAGGWPITNTVSDRATNSARFYRVRVDPNTTLLYGP